MENTLPAPTLSAAETSAERASFDEVYGSHAPFVGRLLRALGVPGSQVEDAMQDVFVVVHRQLTTLEVTISVRAWLAGITRRVASDYRRRVSRRPTTSLTASEDRRQSQSANPHPAIEAADLVVKAIAQMPEEQQLIFALVELEQWRIPEVAAALMLNDNTAYSRLRLARAAFASFVAAKETP